MDILAIFVPALQDKGLEVEDKGHDSEHEEDDSDLFLECRLAFFPCIKLLVLVEVIFIDFKTFCTGLFPDLALGPQLLIEIGLELWVRWQPPVPVVVAERHLVQVKRLELRGLHFHFFLTVALVFLDGVLLLVADREREVAEEQANHECADTCQEDVRIVWVVHDQLGLVVREQLEEGDHHQQGQVVAGQHRVERKQVVELRVSVAHTVVDPVAVVAMLHKVYGNTLDLL